MKNLLKNINKARIKLARIIYFRKNSIHVAKGSFIASDVLIGRNTRINHPSHISSCKIGAFCAIAGRLVIRSSDHEIKYLNMQHYFQFHILNSKIKVTGKSNGQVIIGHGVWIGDSVIVLKDVVIGNGAIIGAGSVVTKSIPAYSIAVGNPAKVIKYRFNKDVCEVIDNTRWWEWSIEKLKINKDLFEQRLDLLTKEEVKLLFETINEY